MTVVVDKFVPNLVKHGEDNTNLPELIKFLPSQPFLVFHIFFSQQVQDAAHFLTVRLFWVCYQNIHTV